MKGLGALRLAACVLGLSLVTGCAKLDVVTGKKIPDLKGVERGKTTRLDILQRYGPPQVVDPLTRTASYGQNHLAYEERTAKGWYTMLYLPLYGIPIVGWFSGDEFADTTVFLFNPSGQLVDFAQSRAPTGKRSGFTVFCWVFSGMIIK